MNHPNHPPPPHRLLCMCISVHIQQSKWVSRRPKDSQHEHDAQWFGGLEVWGSTRKRWESRSCHCLLSCPAPDGPRFILCYSQVNGSEVKSYNYEPLINVWGKMWGNQLKIGDALSQFLKYFLGCCSKQNWLLTMKENRNLSSDLRDWY